MDLRFELLSFASALKQSYVLENARDKLAPILVHAEKLQLDSATIAERCNVSSFKLAKWKSGELKAEQSEAQAVIDHICRLALEEQDKL